MDIKTTNPRKVRIVHGGETVISNENDWQKAADELIAKHGAGIPKVNFVDDGIKDGDRHVVGLITIIDKEEPAAQSSANALTHDEAVARGVDAEGEARSKAAELAAVAAGFAPAQPYYARGTRVIQLGVENAQRSREEYDKRPSVEQMADGFVAKIKAENRRDVIVRGTELRMDSKGIMYQPGQNPLYMMTDHAFPSFCQRMGYGGAGYLAKCTPELRMNNVNSWALRLFDAEEAAQQAAESEAKSQGKTIDQGQERRNLVLRLRDNPKIKIPEIYGVVSESYTSFDVDKVAEALKIAMPSDARADVTYDGHRATFNVMFHSNVQPEKYVAGEFFRAGIKIKTDDTGGGSCLGGTYIEQNLCLNLLCIDFAEKPLFRFRHLGSVKALAEKFQEAMAQALKQLEYFLKQWGYVQEEDILARARVVQPDDEIPISISEAIPGFFNGILERELVPVRGRKSDAVQHLVKFWENDQSAAPLNSRARVINALTAYAHKVPQPDPFVEDEIQVAAGGLLYGARKGDGARSQPKPLPWISVKKD